MARNDVVGLSRLVLVVVSLGVSACTEGPIPCDSAADCPSRSPRCAEDMCVSCTTDAHCVSDTFQFCLDYRCVVCTSDSHCGRGGVCTADNYCSGGTEPPPRPSCDVMCEFDSQCAPDAECIDSCCRDSTWCMFDSHCAAGLECVDATCTDTSCVLDSECDVGQECIDRRCEAARCRGCVFDEDCAAGERCDAACCEAL